MTLVIYVLVVWTGYRLWPVVAEGKCAENATLVVEEWFVLLAAASLVNRFVESIVLSLIWLPVPNSVEMGRLSTVGIYGALLFGLAIVGAILLMLLALIRRRRIARIDG